MRDIDLSGAPPSSPKQRPRQNDSGAAFELSARDGASELFGATAAPMTADRCPPSSYRSHDPQSSNTTEDGFVKETRTGRSYPLNVGFRPRRVDALGKSGGTVELEIVPTVEMALLIEMIVNGRMNRGEILQTSHSSESQHCPFSSSVPRLELSKAAEARVVA